MGTPRAIAGPTYDASNVQDARYSAWVTEPREPRDLPERHLRTARDEAQRLIPNWREHPHGVIAMARKEDREQAAKRYARLRGHGHRSPVLTERYLPYFKTLLQAGGYAGLLYLLQLGLVWSAAIAIICGSILR